MKRIETEGRNGEGEWSGHGERHERWSESCKQSNYGEYGKEWKEQERESREGLQKNKRGRKNGKKNKIERKEKESRKGNKRREGKRRARMAKKTREDWESREKTWKMTQNLQFRDFDDKGDVDFSVSIVNSGQIERNLNKRKETVTDCLLHFLSAPLSTETSGSETWSLRHKHSHQIATQVHEVESVKWKRKVRPDNWDPAEMTNRKSKQSSRQAGQGKERQFQTSEPFWSKCHWKAYLGAQTTRPANGELHNKKMQRWQRRNMHTRRERTAYWAIGRSSARLRGDLMDHPHVHLKKERERMMGEQTNENIFGLTENILKIEFDGSSCSSLSFSIRLIAKQRDVTQCWQQAGRQTTKDRPPLTIGFFQKHVLINNTE